MKNLVCVGTYKTRVEAEIAKGLLESKKIAASISADDAGGAYPFPFQPSPNGVKLLVHQAQKAHALKILRYL